MKESERWEDFESSIVDVDEVEGTDIKITPNFYIHLALVDCQKSMRVENIQDRVFAYRMAVDHLEGVCDAAGLCDEEYFRRVEEFKGGGEYLKVEKDYQRFFVLAKFQFRLLAEKVFSNTTITRPLKG